MSTSFSQYTPAKSPLRRSSPYRTATKSGIASGDVLNASAIPHDGDGEAAGAGASQSYLHSRGADLRSLLLTTEREAAELREECTVRASEVDTLKAALQREHEANLRLQTRHQADLDDMREEYERQQSRLLEQITILKGVSEAAMADKNRATEEATQRKQQLLQLLDREREEKSQLMADYRQQTEQLIAEQGREITGLRNLLEASRSEEEKLLATIAGHEERRNDLEEQLLRAETQLADERVGAQRRLREQDQKLQLQLDAVRAKLDEDAQAHRHEAARWQNVREGLDDAVRSLTERLRMAETQFELDRKGLRESYEADVATLQEEVKTLKEQRERSEAAHRRELERISKGDESLMQSLRKTVESLRAEKQQLVDEARQSRESAHVDFNSKMAQQIAITEQLRRDASDERTAKKEAEAAKQSALIRIESLQSQVTRLTSELEHAQVESRTRERAVEQETNSLIDHLRNQLRAAETEHAALRQQLKKAELEIQRLSDDNDAKQAQLDAVRNEFARAQDAFRSQQDQQLAQAEQQKQQWNRNLDVLHAQKVQLEAESNRLQRNLAELESRYNAAVKQLADERRALEHAAAEIQSLKNDVGNARQQLDGERLHSAEVEEDLMGQKGECDRLREAVVALEANVRDLRRAHDLSREETSRLVREHEDREHDARTRARHAAEALEGQLEAQKEELRLARETQFTLEADVRHLREEASRWQREAIAKDEEYTDSLRQIRQQEETEVARMDGIINALRDDLNRCQIAKTQAQRDVMDGHRDAERRVAVIQEALDAERSSKHRLHEEIRNKEQLSAELQGTVRLLNSRLQSKEDDLRRIEAELTETASRVHEAHSVIGKKDAMIGQLNARLRVFESRGSL